MAILRDPSEVQGLTGIPVAHMRAFQVVANKNRCVIMCRGVGAACTQLIEESYASKGFHVKAKSCNWGPMSGFVLEDPNLTKRGPDELEKQRSDLEHAFQDWRATSTPLYISNDRRVQLLADGVITKKRGNNLEMVVVGKQMGGGGDVDRQLRRYHFILKFVRGATLVNAPSRYMYAVKYVDPGRAVHTSGRGGDQVRAMVNPVGLGGSAKGVRAAITGDYDLFSLAIHKDLYRPGVANTRGRDSLMVSVPQLEANIHARLDDVGMNAHLGNMTGRLHRIRHALNQAFRSAGYMGGNMVHHGSEAGRPFVEEVDLGIFAVAPGQIKPYGLKTLGDIREFINEFGRYNGYVPMLNPGWMSELVFNARNFNKNMLVAARKNLRHVTN